LIPLPKSYTTLCPRCGFKNPISCKACWSCGKILDPSLIEPAKSVKESEEITPKTKTPSEEVIQKWRDYEGNVAKTRKPYDDALVKAMKDSKDMGGSV